MSAVVRCLLLLSFPFFPVPGCQELETMTSHRVGQADNNQQVSLSCGEKLELSLPSTPGTGCHWKVIHCDRSILRPQGEPQFESDDPNGPPGTGGVEAFAFDALAAGETQLELHYVRESSRRGPFDEYHLSVVVSEMASCSSPSE